MKISQRSSLYNTQLQMILQFKEIEPEPNVKKNMKDVQGVPFWYIRSRQRRDTTYGTRSTKTSLANFSNTKSANEIDYTFLKLENEYRVVQCTTTGSGYN